MLPQRGDGSSQGLPFWDRELEVEIKRENDKGWWNLQRYAEIKQVEGAGLL